MYNKFSEIKNFLKIQVDNKTDNRLASFTHYLQSFGDEAALYYEAEAKEYFAELQKNLSINPLFDLDEIIPSKWDVPFEPPLRSQFKFIDLFAGIGGIRLAYQNLGGKCVFTSEWNQYAKKTYFENFGEVPFGDITQIKETEIPSHDILLGGFPCQPFSIAGVSKKNSLGRAHGFMDETQGTLFFDIARIIKQKTPKAFMLENVKNLTSHDKTKTFTIIKETLRELGYSVYAKVLNGKHFVPQHRERIIIVGFRDEIFGGRENFSFPELGPADKKVREILEKLPKNHKYTLSNKLWQYLQDYSAKHKAKGNGFGFGLVDFDSHTRTLSARYYKDGSEILIPQEGLNPRRLTPRECARLQGFTNKFLIPVSDTQAYKQFGNSVTVPLIQAVAEQVVNSILAINEPKPVEVAVF